MAVAAATTWWALVGLLFLNPLLGLATGAALGAGAGALSGKLADYGINDDFIRSVAEAVQPNTSALFILVRKAQPEKVLAEMNMGSAVYATVVPAHGRIILNNRNQLFSLSIDGK